MAYNTPKQFVVYSSANVDMKTVGNTTVFTPNTDFVVQEINCIGISLTGVIGAPIANIGFTGPNYTDLIGGYSTFPTVTGNVSGVLFYAVSVEYPLLPAATPLVFRVATADLTATTNTLRIDITGYYV